MNFANPAGSAAANASAYVGALLEVLGDRDPVATMEETPRIVRELVTSVDDATLRRPEREGKWSMLQVLQHLADTEIVYGWRIRLPLAGDEPPIHGFDQDRWVSTFWRGDERVEDILPVYEGLRGYNVRLLKRLTPEQWERAGMHSERGRETVRHIVKLSAAHDLVHRSQLSRIASALRSPA